LKAAADFSLAAAVALLGLLLLHGTKSIDFGAGYDRIGPRFFPYVVAVGLLVLSMLLAVDTIIRRKRLAGAEDLRRTEPIDWTALAVLGAALLLNIVILEQAGFVIASTVHFWLVCRGFRSRSPARDVLVASLLSLTVYYAFSRGLGLTLPAGILENIS
jgi:putative tricarboxylic transport membrane protein